MNTGCLPVEALEQILQEPWIRTVLNKMSQEDNWRCVAAIEEFNRIVGLPSLRHGAPEPFAREYDRISQGE